MSLTQAVLLGIIILGITILIIVPESRVLLRGFVRLFVENKAKTPEGAASVYAEAIEAQQQRYNQASTIYQQLAGKKVTLEKYIKDLERDISEAERKCVLFVKAGNEVQARVYSEIRAEHLTEYQLYRSQLEQITQRVDEAKQVTEHCEKQLRLLKQRKAMDVAQLKLDVQLVDTYDALDELKKTSATDKLLGAVKEGVEEQHEKAVGAKFVYDSKLSTKVGKADAAFKDIAADVYIEQLKNELRGNLSSKNNTYRLNQKEEREPVYKVLNRD